MRLYGLSPQRHPIVRVVGQTVCSVLLTIVVYWQFLISMGGFDHHVCILHPALAYNPWWTTQGFPWGGGKGEVAPA